ncbi:outer membrane protein [Sphingomonas sp. CLY1604]|uniref:outer membrane protein n=1 Tax=Sphingomonas sp. CLY1604 TaxID=3457786 RepID=UPI003FD8936C
MMGSSAASAQDAADSFIGVHAGAGAGLVTHAFEIEETTNGVDRTRDLSRSGVGGEVFAGYDGKIARRLVLGVQAALDFGGRSVVERNSFYSYSIDPKIGFGVTARLGYAASSRLLLYAGAGVGGQDYDQRSTGYADVNPDLDRVRGVLIRGGVEYALSRRISARLEAQAMNSRGQVMLAVPIRF